MVRRIRPWSERSAYAAIALALPLVLGACSSSGQGAADLASGTLEGPTAPEESRLIQLSGRFVKLTNWPCHRSDYFVGDKLVTFVGSGGSRTSIVTHGATWTGLPANPPDAPLGQCRQVARFEVGLPPAESYIVSINGGSLPPVTLAELEAEGLRHRFRLPS